MIFHFTESGQTDAYRESLYQLAAEKGAEYLHARLMQVDSAAAQAIHPNNVKRVISTRVFSPDGRAHFRTQ